MKRIIKLLRLKKKISFFLFVLIPFFSFSQDLPFKLQSNDLSIDEILSKWSQLSNKTLNYRVDDLPNEKYTFSIEGNYKEVSDKLYPFLGLRYKDLEDVTIVTPIDQETITPDLITIRVVDEDNLSLPFAHVSIEALDILDVTSIDGDVKLEYLIADSDTLRFRYLGYEDHYTTLGRIRSNNNRVMLSPSSESISEIIVVGSTLESIALEKIDPDDIPQAGSVDQDAITIAQNLPGVNNPSESFLDLIIRGGSPDQVQYQWNGIRVLQASHFFGKISSVNPYMIDKLEISKDGYSAAAHGTVSGGLHMKSKNRVDSLSSSVHLNLLYANLGVSLPITPKLSAKFAFRQSLPERLQSSLANAFQEQTFQFGKITDEDILIQMFDLEKFVQTETGVKFGDRQVSLWFQPTPKLSLNFDLIHIENELNFETISEELDISKRDILFQTNLGSHFSARYFWNASMATSLDWSRSDYKYQYQEFTKTNPSNNLRTEHLNNTGISNLKFTNKIQSKLFNTKLGYEYNTWESEVIFANREENSEDRYKNNTNEHVAFLTIHPKIFSDLHLDFGIRWSAYNKSLQNRKLLEPRLHLKYRLNSKIQLHGHFGKYHQYLSRRNFFTPFQADNGFWYLADESATDFLDFIDIVQSTQYGGGLDLSFGALDLSFDIFQKNLFNIWSSSFDLSIDENPFNVGDVDIFGIEIMGRFQKKNHKILATYEYTNEKIKFDNIEQPSLNPFSQPHRINVVYEYKWKIVSAILQYNFANGRPFSQDPSLIVNDNGVAIIFDELLTSRVPDYHRFNMSLKTIPFGKKTKHSFGIQVNNIFNRKNIIKNQYFINLLATPIELGILEKAGIARSFNIFWEINL